MTQSNEKAPAKFSDLTSLILDEEYRKKLIEKGVQKAGSMYALGRIMGYTCNSPNWSLKQILEGKQGIPFHRLRRLCEFLSVPLIEAQNHIVEVR